MDGFSGLGGRAHRPWRGTPSKWSVAPLSQRDAAGRSCPKPGRLHRAIAPDPDPIGAMGRADLADQGLPGLMVQFFKAGGLHHQAAILNDGLDAARLLGRDPENDLAHSFRIDRSSLAVFEPA